MIDLLGDHPIEAYTILDLENLNRAFCQLPLHGSVPHENRKTLMSRYQYAKENGWEGLQKPSETTVIDRYGNAFNRFYRWLIDKSGLKVRKPKFEIFGDLTAPLQRTSFNDIEAHDLYSMPTFTGHDPIDRWKPGPVLTQSGIYWTYLFEVVLGLRPSESAQVDPNDIKRVDGFLYFDLRPYDPAKGRVLRSQMRQMKTDNAARFVVIPPMFVDLGLLELAERRIANGDTRLLMDIKPKLLPGGDLDWGAAAARDWQERKLFLSLRKNVSGYSGRHLLKDLLKRLGIPEAEQERMMGHAVTAVSRGYGGKEGYDEDIASRITAADTPFLRWLRDTLVAAFERAKASSTLIQS